MKDVLSQIAKGETVITVDNDEAVELLKSCGLDLMISKAMNIPLPAGSREGRFAVALLPKQLQKSLRNRVKSQQKHRLYNRVSLEIQNF